MEPERQHRPLLVAAGIALAVLALLVSADVGLYRCAFTTDVKGDRSRSSWDGAPLERSLRLWLDAGELSDGLERALRETLAARGARVTLEGAATGGGQVTVRALDASLYTPLYSRAKASAALRFEARGAEGASPSEVKGDTQVQLDGACYGLHAPSRFRDLVGQQLAAPFVDALLAAFE